MFCRKCKAKMPPPCRRAQSTSPTRLLCRRTQGAPPALPPRARRTPVRKRAIALPAPYTRILSPPCLKRVRPLLGTGKRPRDSGAIPYFSHTGVSMVLRAGTIPAPLHGRRKRGRHGNRLLVAEGDKVPAHGGEPQNGGAVCPHGHGFPLCGPDGFGRGEGVHRV